MSFWRRLRSIFGRDQQPAPPAPDLPEPPASPSGPDEAGERAERLASRLLEDESLRRHLADDEAEPLLDWATRRAETLMRATEELSSHQAEARLEQVSTRLRDVLRLINLAVGERETAAPPLLAARLQALDTLLGPPLLDPEQARRAHARLDALLATSPEQLAARPGRELVRELCELLD